MANEMNDRVVMPVLSAHAMTGERGSASFTFTKVSLSAQTGIQTGGMVFALPGLSAAASRPLAGSLGLSVALPTLKASAKIGISASLATQFAMPAFASSLSMGGFASLSGTFPMPSFRVVHGELGGGSASETDRFDSYILKYRRWKVDPNP